MNQVGKFEELFKVGGFGKIQNIDNLLHTGTVELLGDSRKIIASASPELNFLKGARLYDKRMGDFFYTPSITPTPFFFTSSVVSEVCWLLTTSLIWRVQ